MADVDAADLDRLRALTRAGADFYQNGQVLLRAVSCPKDSPELVTFVLSANPTNDRYIEAVQADGKTYAGYLIATANSKNNKNAAEAIKSRLNFILVQDAEAGNFLRVQAHLKLGLDLIDLKFKRPDGHTALMVAVVNKRVDVAGLLLDHGADVTLKNAKNKSARDLCGNDVRLVAMLEKITMANDVREKIKKNGPSLSPEDIGRYLDKGVQVICSIQWYTTLLYYSDIPLSYTTLLYYSPILLSYTTLLYCSPILLSYTALLYYSPILLSYTTLLYYSPILLSYTTLLYCSPILLSYTALLYYSPILLSYTTLLYYSPILLSYTALLYYSPILLSYTTLLCYSPVPLLYCVSVPLCYTTLLYYSPILLSCTTLLYYSLVPLSYTTFLYYSPMLLSYTTLLCYSPILLSYITFLYYFPILFSCTTLLDVHTELLFRFLI